MVNRDTIIDFYENSDFSDQQRKLAAQMCFLISNYYNLMPREGIKQVLERLSKFCDVLDNDECDEDGSY